MPHRHGFAVALLVLSTTTAAACETGWDLEGRVVTTGALDRSRPLHVYMIDAPTIDLDQARTGAGAMGFLRLESRDTIPDDEVRFSDHAFGCHQGAVAVVAWAPAATPAPGPSGWPLFAPRIGDYVALSDVRHPYCGSDVRTEHVDVTLDGQTYP